MAATNPMAAQRCSECIDVQWRLAWRILAKDFGAEITRRAKKSNPEL
jgi:hypothetical protein